MLWSLQSVFMCEGTFLLFYLSLSPPVYSVLLLPTLGSSPSATSFVVDFTLPQTAKCPSFLLLLLLFCALSVTYLFFFCFYHALFLRLLLSF